MPEHGLTSRPRLILYVARYEYAHKNAVAATLAWMAEAQGHAFEVYYDAVHAGRHYGGSDPHDAGLWGTQAQTGLALLTGGHVSGGRHLEALALALQRFETTVFCSGEVAFSNTLAALADDSGAAIYTFDEDDIAGLYETIFSVLALTWPETAVMVNTAPAPDLDGIDAYCYPEIFYERVVGIEASARQSDLEALRARGVRRVSTCGVSVEQQKCLAGLGFEVCDLGIIHDRDDYATITCRLAKRWKDRREGWMIGDPALVSYWLPTACREHRTPIFSIPHSRIIKMLQEDIAPNTRPVLGRQYDDSDFFTLSRLGQSFQVIDPCRPPLPVLQTIPSRWSSLIPDPRTADPSDAELLEYVRQGRVLVSLAFWTGMIRETENLFALMDLFALTRLRAGIVLTAQSLAWRPSPLDLLTVPYEQGGVYPNVEILMGSCGTGVAIESLLSPERLGLHLRNAWSELERMGIPRPWWPEGWWSTMDPEMVPVPSERAAKRVRWNPSAPYFVQFRFHRREKHGSSQRGVAVAERPDELGKRSLPAEFSPAVMRERLGTLIRGSKLERLFEAYRPYEDFEPGPVIPELADAVQQAGFSYMLTKSGFRKPPQIMYRNGDFVALNYTAGQWDGWTPFETINDVADLQRAEKSLLASGRPGWLLGGIDACLWAFSGELWEAAPRLLAIARCAASGGSSGKLINVPPRVLARYARLIDTQKLESSNTPVTHSPLTGPRA